MKKLNLKPNQVLVPGEYKLGNEDILKIYHRIFQKGQGDILPPVIVVKPKDTKELSDWLEEGSNDSRIRKFSERYSIEAEARRDDYRKLFSMLEKSPYFLIDGNHRSAAAALSYQSMPALELETDSDLIEVKRLVDGGDLFNFHNKATTLNGLIQSYVLFCLDISTNNRNNLFCPITRGSTLRPVNNAEARVNQLVSNGDLPQYMIQAYHETKPL